MAPVLPPSPVQEKIVIYADTSSDVMQSKLQLADRESLNGFERLQKVIRLFMMNKESSSCGGNEFYQFALMVDLGGSPSLLDSGDFHDAKAVMERLDSIRMAEDSSTGEKTPLDIGEAIRTVKQSVYIHSPSSPPERNIPVYVTRLIMFITRSRSLIKLEITDNIKKIMENPLFIVDVLYLHENLHEENVVTVNLATLTQLNELQKGRGYILDIAPDITDWHNASALLLANTRLRTPFADLEFRKKKKEPIIMIDIASDDSQPE